LSGGAALGLCRIGADRAREIFERLCNLDPQRKSFARLAATFRIAPSTLAPNAPSGSCCEAEPCLPFLKNTVTFPCVDESVGRRMAKINRGAGNIDAHVARQFKAARLNQNVSQRELADALGISFQQLQKYESGANRMSAGRLFEAAHVLGLPISYFFAGVEPPARLRKRR
jgi:DNA-binding XRE family transcriptional regulator